MILKEKEGDALAFIVRMLQTAMKKIEYYDLSPAMKEIEPQIYRAIKIIKSMPTHEAYTVRKKEAEEKQVEKK